MAGWCTGPGEAGAGAILDGTVREIRLARSAAPAEISRNAGVWILTGEGYIEVASGPNGFVCYVARSTIGRATDAAGASNTAFYNPAIRAPHCMNAEAASSIFAWHRLTTRLALAGRAPAEIDAELAHALANGTVRPPRSFAIAYMWSERQHLGANIGNWKPHMMVYVPFLHEAMVGPSELLGDGPRILDAGTPWSVLVVPVRNFAKESANG